MCPSLRCPMSSLCCHPQPHLRATIHVHFQQDICYPHTPQWFSYLPQSLRHQWNFSSSYFDHSMNDVLWCSQHFLPARILCCLLPTSSVILVELLTPSFFPFSFHIGAKAGGLATDWTNCLIISLISVPWVWGVSCLSGLEREGCLVISFPLKSMDTVVMATTAEQYLIARSTVLVTPPIEGERNDGRRASAIVPPASHGYK